MWPRWRAYSSTRWTRIQRRLTCSPLRSPRAGTSRSRHAAALPRRLDLALIRGNVARGVPRVRQGDVAVRALGHAVVVGHVVLVMEHDPKPIRLDLGEMPHHPDEAESGRRHAAARQLIGIESRDLEQHGVAVEIEPAVQNGSFLPELVWVAACVVAFGDDRR